jgi:amino acid adenylation domain-containing protein
MSVITVPLAPSTLNAWARFADTRDLPLGLVVAGGAALASARISGDDTAALALVSPDGTRRIAVRVGSRDTFGSLVDRTVAAPVRGAHVGGRQIGVAMDDECGTAELDVVVRVDRAAGRTALVLTYDTDETWATDFVHLLIALTTDGTRSPERPLAALRSHHPALVVGAPRGAPGACVHESFMDLVARQPRALAAIDDERHLEYEELAGLAAGVAAELRGAGVVPDDRVGVCLGASPHVPVALLGVLFAGATYVPMDPETPPRRLAYMVGDSGARAVVTTSAELKRLPAGIPSVLVDHAPRATPQAIVRDLTALAYIVYTSGTTGWPKGVAVDHASLAAVVRETAEFLELHHDARVLQHTSLGFDPATLEVFLALATGGTLVHASRDALLTPGGLEAVIANHGAEVWIGTPTLLALVDPDHVPTLGRLAVGGELMPPQLAQRWGPGRRCFNVYGPSEGTVLTTAYRCTGAERVSPPIGKPLPGRECVVVDETLRAVAPGELGEICLGGLSLARGYWRRPDLTDERFVSLPTVAGGRRFYRTGDLGRMSSDGTLRFVGRVDRQVKVRGHRIELEEIERALLSLDGVAQAAVTTEEGSDGERLVAFVAGADSNAPAEGELRARLGERLPGYMLPHRVVTTEAMPRTTNGKLATDAAATDVEALLLAIFREALERDDVDVADDFFLVGGDSLAAVHALTAAMDVGVTISPATFYAERSVKRLAAVLSR